jgi:hypothetical protein
MDNEICEARMGSSRYTAWVLHVIRFGLDALPANPPQPAGHHHRRVDRHPSGNC